MNWHVREVAEPRGYNMHKLALEAGLSYLTVRGIWANTSTRTDLDSIAKLCKVLQCQPNDIIKLNSEPTLPDEVDQLLHVLTAEPQSISVVCRRLRMSKAQLEQLVREHKDTLEEQGMVMSVATASEVKHAIQLPSTLNSTELTPYSKLSRQLTR